MRAEAIHAAPAAPRAAPSAAPGASLGGGRPSPISCAPQDGDETIGATEVVGMAAASAAWAAAMDAAADDERRKEEAAAAASRAQASEAAAAQADRQDTLRDARRAWDASRIGLSGCTANPGVPFIGESN